MAQPSTVNRQPQKQAHAHAARHQHHMPTTCRGKHRHQRPSPCPYLRLSRKTSFDSLNLHDILFRSPTTIQSARSTSTSPRHVHAWLWNRALESRIRLLSAHRHQRDQNLRPLQASPEQTDHGSIPSRLVFPRRISASFIASISTEKKILQSRHDHATSYLSLLSVAAPSAPPSSINAITKTKTSQSPPARRRVTQASNRVWTI